MKYKKTIIEVKINQDPIPGWGNTAEDHVTWLQNMLTSSISHYHPIVTLIKEVVEDEK